MNRYRVVARTAVLASLTGALALGSACANGNDDPGAGGASGACAADCSALEAPACQESVCNDGTGECEFAPAHEGESCDDGLFCTVDDACEAGACTGGRQDCDLDVAPCDAVICDEDRKMCSVEPKIDGQLCVPDNPCLTAGTCLAQECVGVPVGCDDLPLPNECNAAECNPATGMCEFVPIKEGEPCEGAACKDSVCNAGDCVAVADHTDGTACIDEGDLCIQATCSGGVCVNGDAMDCGADLAEFNPFYTCYPAGCMEGPVCSFLIQLPGTDCGCGSCNGAELCVPNPSLEGMACDDGNSCTSGTTCTDNVCSGGTSTATTFFSEDFSDNAAGWTLEGQWEVGPATSSSGNDLSCGFGDPDRDATPTSDNGVAGTAIGGNITVVVGSAFYLTSPVIDTSGASAVFLRYERWLNTDMGPSQMNSNLEVFDGSGWVEIWSGAGFFAPKDASWAHPVHDLTPYANANMRIRFGYRVGVSFADDCSGWNIDDVVVQDQHCD